MRHHVTVGTTLAAFVGCSSMALASIHGLDLGHIPLPAVDIIELTGPDHAWLDTDDARRNELNLTPRFAVGNSVAISPADRGTWEHLQDGRMMWRLRVLSPGAYHINFGFGTFNLPDSAELTIYSADGLDVMNTLTSLDNPTAKEYWTRVIHNDEVVIEVSVDPSDRLALMDGLVLTSINEGYRGLGAPENRTQGRGNHRGSSESCNVDVVCPLGDDWWNEIPAAGVYTINGQWTCSGTMLNNTNQDETPYFLTAEHCGISNGNDQSVVVYWNHQNSTCRTGNSSGNNGNGNYNSYTSGSTYLTSNSNTDFCLIRLNNDPNPAWEITFAGWNRTNSGASGGVCIHHPNTAEKRISSVQQSYSNGQYWGINWDEGRTYYGSSGSGLFNSNHQVIGALCCGGSFCTNDQDDYFGKSLFQSWSQMSSYLDPAGTGASSLNTLNPYDGGGNGGVCCLNGQCYIVAEQSCTNAGGAWQPEQTCGSVNCANPDPTGGCCVGTSCSVATESGCSGTYLGDGTDCSDDPCAPDPEGGCCIGVSCIVYTPAQCASAGGSYLGDDTNCAGSPCGTGTVDMRWSVVGPNLVDGIGDSYTVDVYASLPDGWRLDAVAGNSNQQKTIVSSTSFYQDPYGGPTSASINPAFYPLAPGLPYDSRVTIGCLDQSGDPYDENNLGDIGINWTSFEAGGDLSVNDGTWFILPVDAQGASAAFTDSDCTTRNGVLIARLTSVGLGSEIMVEALMQGRDSVDASWQDNASVTITYNGEVDCNGNGASDTCDIANGDSQDANNNGVPDECESDCPGDADGDGDTDVDDILEMINGFGTIYDVDDILECIADYGCE